MPLAGYPKEASLIRLMAVSEEGARDYRGARERAALRRLAALVCQAASPEEVFAAVSAEAGQFLETQHAVMCRYDRDGGISVVAAWSGADPAVPVGKRMNPGGDNVHTLVFQTGRAARMADYRAVSGPSADVAREFGIRSAVGAPVYVESRLWGVMIVTAPSAQALPADTEERLAEFTELAATAIANAQARTELRQHAEEQAALRRIAVLVARGAGPNEVFAAVTTEVGSVLGTDFMFMVRYNADETATIISAWASKGIDWPAVGTRYRIGGRNSTTLVYQTGRQARVDDYGDASGDAAAIAAEQGYQSTIGAPIKVAGHLWGLMLLGTRGAPLPPGTEARLAEFTDLAGTAIANAEAQAALTASRARIVSAADQTRRRIERDLHDGAQQRLVSLRLRLRAAQLAPPAATELPQWLEGTVTEVTAVLEELREIARGLHPAALAEGGLRPALRALARRSSVPVRLHLGVPDRLPEPVEIAAYYVVAEALTNIVKHARATAADVVVAVDDGVVHVDVRDDGCGGADFGRGSGLVGMKDRVEALGGRLSLDSPQGAGTALEIVLPTACP
jgi:signal transduction histidine kinase